MMGKFLIIMVITLLFSCNFTQSNNMDNNQEIDTYLDQDTLYWKMDTDGCLHLRDINMLDHIIDNYHLVGNSYSSVVRFLGVPSNIVDSDDGFMCLYYLKNYCNNNEQTNPKDRSWIYLEFDLDSILIQKPDIVCIE